MPVNNKAAKPIFRSVGNILYSLGFFAETRLLLAWRFLRDAGIFLAQMAGWLFAGVVTHILRASKAAIVDIAAPFKHFFSGVRGLRRLVRKERKKGNKQVTRQVTGYLTSGLKNHGYLVPQMLRFVVPVLALGVFLLTITSVLGMQYALSVQVGDYRIGYVENETVLEDGLNLLRMKINLAEDEKLDDWEFTPILSVAPTNVTLNKTQVADKILESSPEKLQKGYGLYIEGVLQGATADGERLRLFLEAKKEPYANNPQFPDAEVSFVRNIEVSAQEEVFFAAGMRAVEDIEKELSRNVTEAENYTSRPGDTLGQIAVLHGLTLEELRARNPGLEGKGEKFKPEEGSVLLIHPAQPFLQVQTIVRSSVVEAIPFETKRENVDTRRKGQQATVQQGVDGQELVWYDSFYIDGELANRVRIDELSEVLVPAQTKLIEVGTAEGGFASIGGSGAGFIWPVPDAKYSYRGFSGGHKALDINAPTGTPIYAAAGGEVIVSTSHFSYGNYIMIQHPDGLVSLYAHASELLVPVGTSVNQGDAIALVGSTGYSTGPHCHFEIRVGGTAVDPATYVIAPWA